MQIDGHHTLTYIAARLAKFSKTDAAIIAHSAQYVDDATNSGVIHFKNGAMYKRISSAHKMLDYRNSQELANHLVWIPFHFLPGNQGMQQGENPDGSFIHKLICTPDSHVARDMLRLCVMGKNKPYTLQRLGIAMHVYADTWAHQGFAGINHKVNEVNDLDSKNKSFLKRYKNKIVNFFISEAFPLGHGAALSYPDQPSIIWEYENGLGEKVSRDNTSLFIDAVDKMCRAMQCYKKSDASMDLESMPGLPTQDKSTIQKLLKSIKDESGEDRHEKWINEILQGSFSFGPEQISYIGKGKGSWKHKAIGQLAAIDNDRDDFPFRKSFLRSQWKLFHDALQAHRFEIMHDVLPRYGICAA